MSDSVNVHRLLAREHRALMTDYGDVQRRCSLAIREQALEIARLAALAMRLQTASILRETRIDWLGVARRRPPIGLARADSVPGPIDAGERDRFEASLRAADLVICQTGCVGHGDYWRVQDHCRRTGKPCVVVEQPDALRIVHVRSTPGEDGGTRITVSDEAGG